MLCKWCYTHFLPPDNILQSRYYYYFYYRVNFFWVSKKLLVQVNKLMSGQRSHLPSTDIWTLIFLHCLSTFLRLSWRWGQEINPLLDQEKVGGRRVTWSRCSACLYPKSDSFSQPGLIIDKLTGWDQISVLDTVWCCNLRLLTPTPPCCLPSLSP